MADWERIDSWFFREHGMRPAEVDCMTLSEIAVCMMESGPRPRHGQRVDNAQRVAYAQRWASLTPLQRLQEGARELGFDV